LGSIASGSVEVLMNNMENVTALLVGPGLGLDDTTRGFLENLIDGVHKNGSQNHMGFVQNPGSKEIQKTSKLPPLIIDADGLKLLAKLPDWFTLISPQAILTPHPGEMSLLTGFPIEKIQDDRLKIASIFANKWGHVVVLKGAFTVIAAPDGRTTTIPVATPALAHAGTGDVLAGLIAGLRAQGMEAYEAAQLGAWVHAQAGLAAAVIQGSTAAVLAGDIIDAVADILAEMD
jgi:hydroxyethylthiazole kinase-like uncharacterized protein yjeF